MKAKTLFMILIMFMISVTMVHAELMVESVSYGGDSILTNNGTAIQVDQSLRIERGEKFDLRVKLKTNESVENVVVSAEILGYEFSQYDDLLQDQTPTFDMEAGDSKFVNLGLTVPIRAEKDQYDLRIRVASRKGKTLEYLVGLRITGETNKVIIKDINIPDTVVAGRSIIGNVRVKNIADSNNEETVKVTLSIPDLGISDSEYIDDLSADDVTSSEDLLLRIPACAEAGFHDVVATVKYNDYEETTTQTTKINVLESDVCETSQSSDKKDTEGTKTVITVPGSQEINSGQSAVYPIIISNLGKSSKTYVLSVSPSVEAFGTYRIDPSNVMIVNGESTQTVYLYLTVDENAQSGLKDFKVTIKTDGETKDVALSANVIGSSKEDSSTSTSLKSGLQLSLLVLVVVLLILLIVYGINKMKGSKNEDEEEDVGQTYY